MRILGIDPGSTVTGYGVVAREGSALRHVAHGTVRPRRGATSSERLAQLHAGICELVAAHAPDVAAVEQVFVRPGNPKSALVLGQARGVALAALGAAGLPTVEPTAQAVKLAVAGTGAASKEQVQAMVRRLLSLDRPPPADAADALAAAICRAHQGRLADLPLASRAARGRASRNRDWVVRRSR